MLYRMHDRMYGVRISTAVGVYGVVCAMIDCGICPVYKGRFSCHLLEVCISLRDPVLLELYPH